MMITLLVIGGAGSVYADKVDFSKCAANPDHHCYSYKPGVNLHPTLGSSWSFDIFMPDGTCNIKGHMDNQGNCDVSQVKLSVPNYTHLQQNPGVFSVENIANTGSPNVNYCPIGMFTLLHEDGYLYKVFNNQTGLDLTDYMYPSFCYSETGANPWNGHSVVPVPEFPQVGIIVLAIAVLSLIIFTTKSEIKKW